MQMVEVRNATARHSARAALKTATLQDHDRAEARWFCNGTFAGRAAYMLWLQAMAATHVRFGMPAVAALGEPRWQADEAMRTAALTRDIGQVPAINATSLSSDAAWGALYVLNGSAMGATVLLKSGAIPADWPQTYLRAMQDFARTGGLRDFFDRLEKADFSISDAIATANKVFRSLDQGPHSVLA